MTRATLRSTPVPEVLYLAVDDGDHPSAVPVERGRSSVFAYSVADDRPAARGTTASPVARRSLIDDERRGGSVVQIDAAGGQVEGLPVVDPKRRGHGLLSIPPEHVRVLRLTATDGIWAEIASQESGPDSAWKLLTTGADARTLCVVLDPDPDAWCARVTAALGPRPHPEVSVVDGPDALPRAWRRAGRTLLPVQDLLS